MKHLYLIIILILAVVYSMIYTIYETFESVKKIYLIWRNLVSDETHHGFGDKLRGAIYLNHYCKENGFQLIVDGTDDICSEFLKNINSSSYDYIKDKKLVLFTEENRNDDEFYNIIKNNEEVFTYTNIYPKFELNDNDKEFAKYISEPQEFMKIMMNEKTKQLPHNYGIQHFRFSDDVFKNDIQEWDSIFIEFFNILKENYQPTDILLSNSNNFKKYAKENLGIKTVDCGDELCKVEHIGHSTDYESTKNSFIEFYIVTNAKYIKGKSFYGNISNFVFWPSKIYDIPYSLY